MNRQQGKCILGSACMHGMLCLVLVVGPALMTRKVEDTPSVITLINATITDGPSGGGTAGPVAPPPADPPAATTVPVSQPEVVKPVPEQPKPQPEIKPVEPPTPKIVDKPKVEETPKATDGEMKLTPVQKKKVEPPKTTVKESNKRPLTAQKVEIKAPVKSVPKVDLSKQVKRDTKALEDETAKANAEREGQRRQELAKLLGKGASNIKSKTSAPTTVEATGSGDGTGGQAFIDYSQYVGLTYKSEYDDALAKASGIGSGDLIVLVSVTISSSGKVTSSEITKKSGNRDLDRLVQSVLRGVQQIRGFPAGAKDSERTFNLRFKLNSESGQG